MRILVERGRELLRRSAARLDALAQFAGRSAPQNLPVSSPGIRRAIVELCESRSITSARSFSTRCADRSRPLAYRVGTRLVEGRAPAGGPDAEGVTTTRFDVVEADPGLLTFLGQHAPGFHVFELRCAGLETLWRGDLAKVQETRRPVLAAMTIYAGTQALEIEHLTFPVIESGRILELRGWFDEAYGNPIPSIDWKHVRHVRRNERSRTVALPRQLMRAASKPGTSEISVLYAEDPGIRARFEAGFARGAAVKGRRRLSLGACDQPSRQ